MIRPELFIEWLSASGVSDFVGVPDSLLRAMSVALEQQSRLGSVKHVIAANEGAAVGYALGAFLESGEPALVYMQNSGLGNAINPLAALAHRNIYGTPMVLLIGWRGEPGRHDEPQHLVQGAITRELLKVLGIPYLVLDSDEDSASKQVSGLVSELQKNPQPMALLVPAGTFAETKLAVSHNSALPLSREDGLRITVETMPQHARAIATTGMLGRELWEIRGESQSSGAGDFMVVGGMGHASAIAHGVAEKSPETPVWCLDGDGSLLMHLGSVAVIGDYAPRNLKHVLFNNFAHDSVGGQPTSMKNVQVGKMADALGYRWIGSASTADEVKMLLSVLADSDGPAMVEIQVRTGARNNLGRPPTSMFSAGHRFPPSSHSPAQ